MLRPCTVCGELTPTSRCQRHDAQALTERHSRMRSAQQRGYDHRWHQLSLRARRAQPFCADCGRTDSLTADHSPEAWARRERGQVIRLSDVDVVCGPCNTRRGPARPGGGSQAATPRIRRGWGEFVSDTGGSS